MGGFWRVIIAVLVVGIPIVWLPAVTPDVTAQVINPGSDMRGPLANDDDPEDLCGSSNPRKQKKCRYNGWDNDNWWDNDNQQNKAEDAPPPPPVQVDMWRSTENPAPNVPLMVAVKGTGAPIARVSWWATGPTADNPTGDDMAHWGEQGYDCGGIQSCAWSWTVIPRHNGYYAVHAKVRDTTGNEVETVWEFTSGQPPTP